MPLLVKDFLRVFSLVLVVIFGMLVQILIAKKKVFEDNATGEFRCKLRLYEAYRRNDMFISRIQKEKEAWNRNKFIGDEFIVERERREANWLQYQDAIRIPSDFIESLGADSNLSVSGIFLLFF